MPVAYTSRLALATIAEDLGGQCRKVYEAIRDWNHPVMGPCIRDLAKQLELETATVSGRISDLRKAGAIEDGQIKLCAATGKQVKTYIALAWAPPDPHAPAQLTLL